MSAGVGCGGFVAAGWRWLNENGNGAFVIYGIRCHKFMVIIVDGALPKFYLLKLSNFFVGSKLPSKLRVHSSKVWHAAIDERLKCALSLNDALSSSELRLSSRRLSFIAAIKCCFGCILPPKLRVGHRNFESTKSCRN